MPEMVYGVIGAGRWGSRMIDILMNFGRRVVPIKLPRRAAKEGDMSYNTRLVKCLTEVDATVNTIWLAVSPGHQFSLVDAALDRNWHVVVEKPWDVAAEKADSLRRKAQQNGLQIGIHHQFCYLSALPALSKIFGSEDSCTFSGVFNISRGNHLGLDPLCNLGSHLIAIRELHFPTARIVSIKAAYESMDQRSITLRQRNFEHCLDFTDNNEPLIQRYILEFERAVRQRYPFRIGIDLAKRVHQRIEEFEAAKYLAN